MRQFIRKLIFSINKRKVLLNSDSYLLPNSFEENFSIRKNNLVEKKVYEFIKAALRKSEVFIDVGANFGLLTCLASKCVGEK